MVKIIDSEWVGKGVYRSDFVIDSTADVAALPKAAPGSVAIVADKGGAVYMVNASGEWKEI